MPIYEFVCKKCGQQFDEMKSMGDFSSNCPCCGFEAEKIMSATSNIIKNGTNRSVDSIIGEDANRRWQLINDSKSKRVKEQFGNVSEKDAAIKDNERIANVLNKQNDAYNVIKTAKEQAGITKYDETAHLLKG